MTTPNDRLTVGLEALAEETLPAAKTDMFMDSFRAALTEMRNDPAKAAEIDALADAVDAELNRPAPTAEASPEMLFALRDLKVSISSLSDAVKSERTVPTPNRRRWLRLNLNMPFTVSLGAILTAAVTITAIVAGASIAQTMGAAMSFIGAASGLSIAVHAAAVLFSVRQLNRGSRFAERSLRLLLRTDIEMERARTRILMSAMSSLPPGTHMTMDIAPSSQEGDDIKLTMTKSDTPSDTSEVS